MNLRAAPPAAEGSSPPAPGSSPRPYVSYEHTIDWDLKPVPVPTPSVAGRLDAAFEQAPLPSWEEPLSTRPNMVGDIFANLGARDYEDEEEEYEEREDELDFEDMLLEEEEQREQEPPPNYFMDETPVVPPVAYQALHEEAREEPQYDQHHDQHHASPVTIPAAPVTQRLIDPKHEVPIWEVWVEGSEPVGPVTADQIARGIQSGKVPGHASVKRASDLFWADLFDVPEIVAALKSRSTESAPPPPPIAPNLVARQYMVWVEGSDPVGPVSADQIARGIRAGKVPSHASIQRVGELFASDALDEPDVIAALKQL